MKHVILFGGSFSPIHNGHIGLARYVLRQGIGDEVWLMVSPQNPLKQNSSLLAETERLRLCQKAVEGEEGINVTDFEFHLPRPSYTWNTLQALSKAYPNTQFSLLVGADNWNSFAHWAHPDDILRNHHLYVYPREGSSLSTETLPPTVHYLPAAPLYPYSSTKIRERLERGENISAFVPNVILQDLLRLYPADKAENQWTCER